MTASQVRASIACSLGERLEHGLQPMRCVVGLRAYRLLAEDQGLEPRSIGKNAATSVRFKLGDIDLPVDCLKEVRPGDEFVTAIVGQVGRA